MEHILLTKQITEPYYAAELGFY